MYMHLPGCGAGARGGVGSSTLNRNRDAILLLCRSCLKNFMCMRAPPSRAVVEKAEGARRGLASAIGALAISFAKAEVLYVVLVECLSYVHVEGLASDIVDKAIMSYIHARWRRVRRRFFGCRACRMLLYACALPAFACRLAGGAGGAKGASECIRRIGDSFAMAEVLYVVLVECFYVHAPSPPGCRLAGGEEGREGGKRVLLNGASYVQARLAARRAEGIRGVYPEINTPSLQK
ncbi:hypothetical protein C8J57DRAFT_363331 [Mycena rebaudengoi]|nr:hypothetical protein C8J57DRAFT_363331 [Mycena rebaudengoi]